MSTFSKITRQHGVFGVSLDLLGHGYKVLSFLRKVVTHVRWFSLPLALEYILLSCKNKKMLERKELFYIKIL